ncbi:MAG: Fur family transcriptional regulator [Myxococcota bacterium]
MNAAAEDAQRRLAAHMRQRGLKHTRQRDEILEAFFEDGGHVSIDDLLSRVQSRMPGVGYATVYRAMKLFSEAGVAHERHFQDGQTRYEPVIADEHHDHLICQTCGHIFEFEDPVVEARQSAVAAQHGLRVTSHRHEIYGSCEAPEGCPFRLARNA